MFRLGAFGVAVGIFLAGVVIGIMILAAVFVKYLGG